MRWLYFRANVIIDSMKNGDTLQQALEYAEHAFEQAGLYYGHGTDNAWDEAVWLTFHTLAIPYDSDRSVLSRELTVAEKTALENLYQQRITSRKPAAYLLQEAWFCGLPFYVDERVIVPRSPIAELIEEYFHPWFSADKVPHILDLCCGSACIAIACAHAFPEAPIDAVDIDEAVLAVAAINVEKHGLQEQVTLIQSDLFAAISDRKYDIIVANPPYVDAEDIADLPEEFHHEPRLALASGDDGLDCAKQIIAQAKQHLTDDGILILEVGNSALALEQQFPCLPLIWLEFARGGHGVALIYARDL